MLLVPLLLLQNALCNSFSSGKPYFERTIKCFVFQLKISPCFVILPSSYLMRCLLFWFPCWAEEMLMSLFLCCFFAFSSLPKAKSKEVKGGISIFHTLALAVMTLPRSTQIERHLQMNFIFLPCTALTSWKNTFVALSKGLVHNWFVTFLLPRFTAEFGPLWASHLTPRPPAPLQGVPLSAPVKVPDFNAFLLLFFYSSSSANTANHRSAKKRESTGVAVRSRPGSSAGVARLEESHQARRALLPLLLLLCHHPTEIYR